MIASPLPIKNGISPNKIWLPDGSWSSIFEFFKQRFPQLSEQQCRERFERNEVCTSDGQIQNIKSIYRSGIHLYFYREVQNEILVPFKETIIFEDDNIVVADKPHFLAVAPSGQYLAETLLVRLRRELNNNDLELCHRLDRETAGLVLLSKKPQLRALYHGLFADREIIKVYHAIAPQLDLDFPITRESRLIKSEPYMRMKEADGENNSKSVIELIERGKCWSLYQLKPTSGKKHQLRVHMSGLNIPIKDDPLYPKYKPKAPTDFESPLQLLAKSLQFIDPVSKELRFFESEQSLTLA